MAKKIDLDDLQMILAAREVNITKEQQAMIMEELLALTEELEEKEDKVRVKNQFIVLPIIDSEEEAELFSNRGYVVAQVPEETDLKEVTTLINIKLREISVSNIGKKKGLNRVSVAIGKIKGKELVLSDGKKIKIKTKIPVAGLPLVNMI